MNLVDIIIIVVLLFFCVKGYFRGFINELFSLLIIAAGLILAFLFHKNINRLLHVFIQNDDLSIILSFVFVFVLATFFFIFFRNILLRFVENANLGDADSVFGMLLGALKGVLICGAILIFIKNRSILSLNALVEKSRIFPMTERVFKAFIILFPEQMRAGISRFLSL